MRYLISVSYDGSKLYGFQRLLHHKTVQGELERVLTKINKTIVYVKGAGRTDRGVHARDQRVHFDLNVDITADRLVIAMNSMLDPAIHVNDATIVDKDFHARFDVKKKTYEYIINVGEYDPLINDYVYNYNHPLNITKMKTSSKALLGAHSYKAFTSGERESYNSIIYDIKIKKVGDLIYLRFTGKSFYRYMVRNLVGALMLVGEGKLNREDILKMIDNDKNNITYPTAPANGLYLLKIEY